MRFILAGVAAALALAAVTAAAQTTHMFSATSEVRVETTADGTVAMRSRNARLVPYALFDGEKYHARLATITSDVRRRTDAEGVDPASSVAFEIKDLSTADAKTLASFSEPGAHGRIVGERYAVATMPGCCAGADVHRVHAAETGKALYTATGDAALGSAAWAEAPNAKPRTVRWAAFDGNVSDKEAAAGLLGHIAYGNDAGKLSAVDIYAKAPDDDLAMGLAHTAALVWLDGKAPRDGGPPASGTADGPQAIWAIEGIADGAKLGGFEVALMLGKRRLATIPIRGDRLIAGEAKSSDFIVKTPPAR
ncbi:MAG: hypothetical protein ACM3JG_13760 [Thiohalocapsa sp.]